MKMNVYDTKNQEIQFLENFDYEEYLRYINPEPTSDDIDNMENVFCKSTILKRSTLNSINNLNYNNLQGA